MGSMKDLTFKRVREGIQKENKVYFENNTFVYINKKGTKIKVID